MRYTWLVIALSITSISAQKPVGDVMSGLCCPTVQPGAIQWRGPGTGLQTAIVEGNPQAAGLFTMMLKLPDGVWIQPHFHNVDKRLVVIKGELLMGHGDAVDRSKTTALQAGGVAVMSANFHHYEGGKGETIVALIANGPFTTTMVTK